MKREQMGHMGLEYMGQDIYLTPPFKLKVEMEDLKRWVWADEADVALEFVL